MTDEQPNKKVAILVTQSANVGDTNTVGMERKQKKRGRQSTGDIVFQGHQ